MKKTKKKLEIVLLKEVADLGLRGEKLLVAKGYAVNYLIPKELAVLSNDPRAVALLRKTEKTEEVKEKELRKAAKIKEKLEGLKIEIKAKTGAKDKLFGSITKKEVLEEIEKKIKLKLGKVEILGDFPIKKTGNYKLKIKLSPTILPEINLKIMGIKKEKIKK